MGNMLRQIVAPLHDLGMAHDPFIPVRAPLQLICTVVAVIRVGLVLQHLHALHHAEVCPKCLAYSCDDDGCDEGTLQVAWQGVRSTTTRSQADVQFDPDVTA